MCLKNGVQREYKVSYNTGLVPLVNATESGHPDNSLGCFVFRCVPLPVASLVPSHHSTSHPPQTWRRRCLPRSLDRGGGDEEKDREGGGGGGEYGRKTAARQQR